MIKCRLPNTHSCKCLSYHAEVQNVNWQKNCYVQKPNEKYKKKSFKVLFSSSWFSRSTSLHSPTQFYLLELCSQQFDVSLLKCFWFWSWMLAALSTTTEWRLKPSVILASLFRTSGLPFLKKRTHLPMFHRRMRLSNQWTAPWENVTHHIWFLEG